MRFAILYLLLLAVVVSGIGCRGSSSADTPPIRITSVQVGIPPGPRQGDEQTSRRIDPLFKVGHWTPVTITVAGDGRIDGATLAVQTTDCDDVLNEAVFTIPSLELTPNEPQRTLIAYCRPGKTDASVSVTIRPPAPAAPIRSAEEQLSGLDPRHYLYCTLGPRLPNLRLPNHETDGPRHAEVGAWDQLQGLPTRWLGYDAVDVAVFCTSDAEFTSGLLNDSARREALLEWVRRGGRLVLCVGRNPDLFQSREDLRPILPVDFAGTQSVPMANVQWPGSAVLDELGDPNRQTPLTLAVVKPKADRNVRRLATARIEGGGEMPLVLQAAYGSGRVTVIATDPDQPPFTRWKRQGEFWERVLRDAGPKFAVGTQSQSLVATESSDNLERHLQNSLESFDSIPVISFSWIALLFLVYIAVIGPLDYLLLKKVFKRLEWTWVTFPAIVVTVSLGAYLAARTLKGDVQRMRKVDLVDYDLIGRTALGHTWFSLFTPRIGNFDVEIQPSTAWGLKESISPPELAALGEARAGRQTLFRRSYQFDADQGILRDVPIPVWSVKSFQARWHCRLDAAELPLLTNLRLVGDEVTGSITSRLPVRLQRVTLLHRNSVYQLGSLDAWQTAQVTPAARISFRDWFSANPGIPPRPTDGNFTPWSQAPMPPPAPAGRVVRQLLFHELWEAGSTLASTPRNAGFRDLDQSWRLSLDDPGASAIVYAQVDVLRGSPLEIDEMSNSPSRLRMRAASRPEETATSSKDSLLQETHVRFFVPIKINP